MSAFAGTDVLIRLIVRRDRIALTIWIVLIVFAVVGTAAALPKAYPTAETRQAFANETNSNPTEIIMLGPIFNSSIGGISAWRVRGWIALGMGLVSLLFVIRHTRAEEETGRRDLLGSTVLGKQAPLTAVLIVVLSANMVIALIVIVGLIGIGLPAAGSVALGLSVAAAGWMFAAIGAAVAQLTESAGTARGIAISILALFYTIRGIADASGPNGLAWLSGLSPYGWTEAIRPYAGEQWLLFAPVVVFVVVLCMMAYALSSRRDIGAGLLPSQRGPAMASPGLRSPLSLAWRLHRNTLIAWNTGFALLGAAIGGVAQNAATQMNTNEQFKALLARMGSSAQPVDSFFALVFYLMGQVVAAYTIYTVLQLRSEEVNQRVDSMLATPVSRFRWAASQLFIAGVGTVAILAATGIATGLIYGLSTGDLGHELPRLLVAALVRVPAAWVLGAIGAAIFGLLPKFAAWATWAILGLLLTLELVVELHLMDPSILNISPFAVSPGFPAASLTAMPLLVLVGIAVALVLVGLVGFQHRDVG